MEAKEYRELTDALEASLRARNEVLGLVALGSMARMGIEPDSWSDHDFFVIVPPGRDEQYRTDLSWIPRSSDIVLSFRETEHGLKVLYRCGHLLEFAVFTPEQLSCARINRYKILFERIPLKASLERLCDVCRTPDSSERGSAGHVDVGLLGKFLCNLLVGVGRFRRGEQLSAHQFVKSYALSHLLTLIQTHTKAAEGATPDNLDPWRRFEQAYPGSAAKISVALAGSVPQAAEAFLQLAAQTAGVEPGHDLFGAFETIKAFLDDAARGIA